MRKFIINRCMQFIQCHLDYGKEELEKIEYGLISIYLLITKLIIISIIAIILGIFKEMIIFLAIYNVVRMPSFGLHATKSWVCLLFSTISFLIIPYLCTVLIIPMNIRLSMAILGVLLMFKNSPADTHKKPILSKKRRTTYKILSTIVALISLVLIIFLKNNFIANCLLFAVLLQCIIISPITYRIFKLPYNNYKIYLKEHPELQIN